MFFNWLVEQFADFGQPFSKLIIALVFISLFFGLSSNPFSAFTGFVIWIMLVCYIYKKRQSR